MPSHRVHLEVDRWHFGRTYPKIHKAMDRPVKFFGRRHRILFHDVSWALYIANLEYPGDFFAEKSACLHLEYDWMCSKDKEFKKFLEKWARRRVRERKRDKRIMKQTLEVAKRKTRKKISVKKDYYYW